jgi:protein-disulfide isomerase
MTTALRLPVVLVPIAFVWVAAPALPAAAQEEPAAIVAGEPMYERDFVRPVADELRQIQQQEYDLKLKALLEEINRRLVHAEAEKRGLTENQLLGEEVDIKVPAPSTQEIERELVSRMFKGKGSTNKEEIADELWQNAILAARGDFYLRLQEQAGVKIRLTPPRVAVEYDTTRLRGASDAPVTIVEFADFHCPYCGQMYPVLKNLLAKYEGKLKFAYRDLPLQEVPPEFIDSPEAARCAAEQGKFWEYHDLLFEHQDQFGESAFKGFAQTLKLESGAFAECLESRKYKEPIEADFQEALRLGATGTPYFFINGIPLGGARPLSDFEDIINRELARAADAGR